MDPISKTFVSALEEYARRDKIPVIQFRKGQRKDDIAAEQRKKFNKPEGVVFIGSAQEFDNLAEKAAFSEKALWLA